MFFSKNLKVLLLHICTLESFILKYWFKVSYVNLD